ncbi:hypothetical protein M2273_002553 [Mucilaginibacter lappiensis]
MLRWVKLALQMRGKFLELEGVTGKTQGGGCLILSFTKN